MVTRPMSWSSRRKVPSLSSASTMNQGAEPQAAPEPRPPTSPPMMKEGSPYAEAAITASMDDVVVLPCVPATATVRRRAQIADRISARASTRAPLRPTSTTSGLSSGIAVDRATMVAEPTLSAA